MKKGLEGMKDMLRKIDNSYAIVCEEITMSTNDDNVTFSGSETEPTIGADDMKKKAKDGGANRTTDFIDTRNRPDDNSAISFEKDFKAQNGQDSEYDVTSNTDYVNWSFLNNVYEDANFDHFFKLTNDRDFKFSFGQLFRGKALFRNNGTYEVQPWTGKAGKLFKDRVVSGVSHFLQPKGNPSPITMFDALFVFYAFVTDFTNDSDDLQRFWSAASDGGYVYDKNLDEAKSDIVFDRYGDMMNILHEFDGNPLIQGYLKVAYHESTNTPNKLRAVIKDELYSRIPNELGNAYRNNIYAILYIPSIDSIVEPADAVKRAVELLAKLRTEITRSDFNNDKFVISLPDTIFWKTKTDILEKIGNAGGKLDTDSKSTSGLDTVSDEISNRLRVLLSNDGSKTNKEDASGKGEQSAKRYREQVLSPAYRIEEELSIITGIHVGQEDIESMKKMEPLEWLETVIEEGRTNNSPSTLLPGQNRLPFSPENIYRLLKQFQLLDSNGTLKKKEITAGGSAQKATAYDFFSNMLNVGNSQQDKIYNELSKNVHAEWFSEFGNNKKLRGTAIEPYVDNARKKGFGRFSLDMVAFNDTQNGNRNFVAIEYQGEHHYRPIQTSSIKESELYPFDGSGNKNDGTFKWDTYWQIMSIILTFIRNNHGSRLNEDYTRVDNTEKQTNGMSRSEFFSSCLNTLQDEKNNGNNSRLKQMIQSMTGYEIDLQYEDSFSRWSHEKTGRPVLQAKPKIKDFFPSSLFRWYCEIDSVVQMANDITKYVMTNSSGIFDIENTGNVAQTLFYVCPNNTKVISPEILSNAISNPYRGEFYSAANSELGLKFTGFDEDMAKNIFTHTFRCNKASGIDINESFSVANPKLSLADAINNFLETNKLKH